MNERTKKIWPDDYQAQSDFTPAAEVSQVILRDDVALRLAGHAMPLTNALRAQHAYLLKAVARGDIKPEAAQTMLRLAAHTTAAYKGLHKTIEDLICE